MENSQKSRDYVEITDSSFANEVMKFPGLVMVDFWADWCGPCHAIAPTIENLATKYKDNPNIKIAKLDTDANPQTSQEQRILSLPTLKFFVNGEEMSELNGAYPPPVIESRLQEMLAKVPAAQKAA